MKLVIDINNFKPDYCPGCPHYKAFTNRCFLFNVPLSQYNNPAHGHRRLDICYDAEYEGEKACSSGS